MLKHFVNNNDNIHTYIQFQSHNMNSGSFYMDIKYIPKFLLIKSLKLSSFVIIITVLIHIIRLYLVRYLLHVKNVKNLLF